MQLLVVIFAASWGRSLSLQLDALPIHNEAQHLLAGLASDITRIQDSLRPWRIVLAHHATGKVLLQGASDPGLAAAAASLPGIKDLMLSMENEWKSKIVAANRAEKEEKAWFTETKRGLDVKAQAWDSHNGKNTYQMIEGYWTRHRALEHRQYHNLLKIAHAGIDRFKSVIRAVDGAEAGKSPDADTARSLHLETPSPDVVLLQIAPELGSLGTWAKEAAKQLAAMELASMELAAMEQSGAPLNFHGLG